ncbi:aminopeptidase O isoform X3 [Triplophysa dalaica]|uniref:aminopeptidase O isoform X3 n=1 Tax=Triplophysa dalaica TaxID=1582913 RepID=UPI0024DFD1A5|nr:aminopeptidase O isoform X3 [Triplophysa dalaica]
MEGNPQPDLDPNRDDLPLRANTNHMLVRHYVLDLAVHFQRKVIGGSIVFFLDPVKSERGSISSTPVQDVSKSSSSKNDAKSPIMPCPNKLITTKYPSDLSEGTDINNVTWDDDSDDFTLVLDCCDLVVSRVEEVDVTTVSNLKDLDKQGFYANADHPSYCLVRRLVSMPSASWRRQQDLYLQCSRSPAFLHEKPLRFHMDQWSLQIRKEGVLSPHAFPCALRIWYETKPTGGSVRWTKDQDGRCCVYTMGSPINNRALFPCQEPPVAMSTWQARVRAPCDYTVLMSGENQAFPEPAETGVLQWDYYVTMPMPASTFTIAVGQWLEAGVKASNSEVVKTEEPDVPSVSLDNSQSGPADQHLRSYISEQKGFSSLGMASPHIVFLSQSVLKGERNLCGARLCHEIAHSWFGLAIGAQDWTEEWISEGFATYLEDMLWAQVQQLGCEEAEEQKQLKALLRWRRLSDELQNSEEELQVLRTNKENTGEVSESGASVVKHALNPGKPFMQVHYVKVRKLTFPTDVWRLLRLEVSSLSLFLSQGYFLLKFLADQVGEENFLLFFKSFVRKFHGRLILSQDFLQMLLDTFSAVSSRGITLETIFSDWLDTPEMPKWLTDASSEWSQTPAVEEVREEVGKWIHFSGSCRKGTKRKRAGPKVNFKELNPEQLVLLLEFLLEEPKLSLSCLRHLHTAYDLQARDAEVRHRWCELVVKHKYTAAYRDVEQFLIHDQAMGVYLYGELMVQEDARQQALARCCLSIIKDDMDQSARSVVEEMIL